MAQPAEARPGDVPRAPADPLADQLGDDASRRAWVALQRQFLERLPARAQRLREAATPEAALAEWHRLAGVAGSYGHDALGDLARRTLAACHVRAADPLDPLLGPILAAALAEFDAALARLDVDSLAGLAPDAAA